MSELGEASATVPRLLKGIRVIDLTWVVFGSTATRLLASMGAEVLRIEPTERARLDVTRKVPPFIRDPEQGTHEVGAQGASTDPIDRSGYYFNVNTGKRGIRLNLKSNEGKDLFRRLVAIGDVVTENFSATAMSKLGLDYPALRRIKEDIIYIQMSGLGNSGPEKHYVSYGPTAQALSGLSYQSGMPTSGPPAGWGYAYLDLAGGYYGAMAALTALNHRQRTGRGQYIDLSQAGVGLMLTGTAILDAVVNERATERTGNRSPHRRAAPHGVYRCRGEDRWCAIAVFSDEEWSALRRAIGDPAWSRNPTYETVDGRIAHEARIDVALGAWTADQTPEAVMQQLQAVGVRAGVVQNARDKFLFDAQLRARGHYVRVPHGSLGPQPVEGVPIWMSETPLHPGGPIQRGAPRWGEDNDYVFGELLGLSDDVRRDYAKRGII